MEQPIACLVSAWVLGALHPEETRYTSGYLHCYSHHRASVQFLMPMDRYSIRSGVPTDLDELIPLFESVYPHNPRLGERDFVAWQYATNPLLPAGDVGMLLSIHDGAISGFLGFVPVEYYFQGTLAKGCFPITWYSSRRDGSGIALFSTLQSRFDRFFLLGPSEEGAALCNAQRIPLLPRVPRWIGIVDAEACARLFEVGTPDSAMLFESASSLYGWVREGRFEERRSLSPDEEYRFDLFPSVRGFCRRNGSYLSWRYLHCPRHPYRLFTDDSGGLMVFRIEEISGTGHRVMRLLEWNLRGEAGEAGVRSLIEVARSEGCVLIDFFCTAVEVGQELERLGFVDEDRMDPRIPFLFRPMKRTAGIMLGIDSHPRRTTRNVNFGEWFITKGEGDVDRVKL